jgi:hypothetical protein
MGKSIWLSKTFWVNLIALAAMLVQAYFDVLVSPEIQLAILAVVNLVLRLIFTGEPIDWSAGGGGGRTMRAAGVLFLVMLLGAPLACGPGLRVCREASLVLQDASDPDLTKVALRCDGATLVEIETKYILGEAEVPREVDPMSTPRPTTTPEPLQPDALQPDMDAPSQRGLMPQSETGHQVDGASLSHDPKPRGPSQAHRERVAWPASPFVVLASASAAPASIYPWDLEEAE